MWLAALMFARPCGVWGGESCFQQGIQSLTGSDARPQRAFRSVAKQVT